MLATITKAEQRAELNTLVAAYLAGGGKIHRDLTPAQKRKRRAWGMAPFNPKEWDANARAQHAQDDKTYYDMAAVRNTVPMYDPVLNILYGRFADSDRRHSKGARIGEELK